MSLTYLFKGFDESKKIHFDWWCKAAPACCQVIKSSWAWYGRKCLWKIIPKSPRTKSDFKKTIQDEFIDHELVKWTGLWWNVKASWSNENVKEKAGLIWRLEITKASLIFKNCNESRKAFKICKLRCCFEFVCWGK